VELGELLLNLMWFLLAWVALALLLGACAGLAFRVNLGNGSWPLEPGDFAWRCALGGAVLAAYLALAYTVTLVIVGPESAGFFWLLMAPYPFVGLFVLDWSFAQGDPFEGFKLFLLQHLVPVVLLLLVALFSAPVSTWIRSLSPWK
jgi:hypothetical protein